jgi:cell division protein FtsL
LIATLINIVINLLFGILPVAIAIFVKCRQYVKRHKVKKLQDHISEYRKKKADAEKKEVELAIIR